MQTYSNRFASIEKTAQGWIVFNEISGLPVYENPEADFPVEKVFPDYPSARSAMLELTERGKIILSGRKP